MIITTETQPLVYREYPDKWSVKIGESVKLISDTEPTILVKWAVADVENWLNASDEAEVVEHWTEALKIPVDIKPVKTPHGILPIAVFKWNWWEITL